MGNWLVCFQSYAGSLKRSGHATHEIALISDFRHDVRWFTSLYNGITPDQNLLALKTSNGAALFL